MGAKKIAPMGGYYIKGGTILKRGYYVKDPTILKEAQRTAR